MLLFFCPVCHFFVPNVCFLCRVHFLSCPTGRLLILSRFHCFVAVRFFCPESRRVGGGPGGGGRRGRVTEGVRGGGGLGPGGRREGVQGEWFPGHFLGDLSPGSLHWGGGEGCAARPFEPEIQQKCS